MRIPGKRQADDGQMTGNLIGIQHLLTVLGAEEIATSSVT